MDWALHDMTKITFEALSPSPSQVCGKDFSFLPVSKQTALIYCIQCLLCFVVVWAGLGWDWSHGIWLKHWPFSLPYGGVADCCINTVKSVSQGQFKVLSVFSCVIWSHINTTLLLVILICSDTFCALLEALQLKQYRKTYKATGSVRAGYYKPLPPSIYQIDAHFSHIAFSLIVLLYINKILCLGMFLLKAWYKPKGD